MVTQQYLRRGRKECNTPIFNIFLEEFNKEKENCHTAVLCSAYNITNSPPNIWFGFTLKFSMNNYDCEHSFIDITFQLILIDRLRYAMKKLDSLSVRINIALKRPQ